MQFHRPAMLKLVTVGQPLCMMAALLYAAAPIALGCFFHDKPGKEERGMLDLENKMDALQDEIREMIREKRYAGLRDLFLPMEPADIALILE